MNLDPLNPFYQLQELLKTIEQLKKEKEQLQKINSELVTENEALRGKIATNTIESED